MTLLNCSKINHVANTHITKDMNIRNDIMILHEDVLTVYDMKLEKVLHSFDYAKLNFHKLLISCATFVIDNDSDDDSDNNYLEKNKKKKTDKEYKKKITRRKSQLDDSGDDYDVKREAQNIVFGEFKNDFEYNIMFLDNNHYVYVTYDIKKNCITNQYVIPYLVSDIKEILECNNSERLIFQLKNDKIVELRKVVF